LGGFRREELASRLAEDSLVLLLAIAPCLIRNQIAFQGQVLYSTLGGHDAVEGVLTPQGRALPGDNEKIKGAEGWILSDIETNDPSRLHFPPE
jgi:hypothetical protein